MSVAGGDGGKDDGGVGVVDVVAAIIDVDDANDNSSRTENRRPCDADVGLTTVAMYCASSSSSSSIYYYYYYYY